LDSLGTPGKQLPGVTHIDMKKKSQSSKKKMYHLSFYPRLLVTYVHMLLPCNTVSSNTHRHVCNQVSTNEGCYHNRHMGDIPSNSPFVASSTQRKTFPTNLTGVHQDIVLAGKFTDLRVTYADQ
jgi:hypothetical protein